MNLVIDIGNTSTKLAVFSGRDKVSMSRTDEMSCTELEDILSSQSINRAVISSVRVLPPFIYDLLLNRIPEVHVVTHQSRLPFSIVYESPETLGPDRIAAVAGAYELFGGENILVIDAGTAITYEFLNGTVYAGGNISPGISLRFRALHEHTSKLPLVSDKEYMFTSPARNTADAIMAGVIVGVSYEINEYIRTFLKNSVEGKVLLTGGDGSLLKEKIDHKVIFKPDLVIDGLNYILEYNAK